MPNKYELITTLYRETLNEVSNPAEWQKFLRTAGYNFRLDFDDQILLYAQKPESTAVLEIEKWNNVFGRWVNKGSTGLFILLDNKVMHGILFLCLYTLFRILRYTMDLQLLHHRKKKEENGICFEDHS